MVTEPGHDLDHLWYFLVEDGDPDLIPYVQAGALLHIAETLEQIRATLRQQTG